MTVNYSVAQVAGSEFLKWDYTAHTAYYNYNIKPRKGGDIVQTPEPKPKSFDDHPAPKELKEEAMRIVKALKGMVKEINKHSPPNPSKFPNN